MAKKKRINIYVDEQEYARFKMMVGATGETVTDVIHHAMREYSDTIEMLIKAGDKDTLMEMMLKRVESEIAEVEKVLKGDGEANESD